MTARNHLYDGLLRARVDDARPFLRLPDGQVWSYAQTLAHARQLARVLAGQGVRPGDRVLVQVEKCPHALCLYLASIYLGAVYLPLNTAYTRSEMEFFATDAEPALIIVDPSQRDAAARIGAKVMTLNAAGGGDLTAAAEAEPDDFEPAPRAPDDLAAILYTSGTTGRPKGAMLTHNNLLSNALTLTEAWRFTADDVLIHALPIFHTHGLFVATNIILAAAASMTFLPKFDADAIFESLPEATSLMGVPTFYTRLCDDPRLTADAVAHMRLFVSGSAPLLAETFAKFEARTGMRILERYGMTETNMIASNPHDGERRAGTVGFPLPRVAVRIADRETGAAVPEFDVGVIEVKGPNVFTGYWRMPEKTAEEFRADGFFITGDLGRFDADGYLHIVGRAKDLVISGGFNVYPKEVETEIDALAGVLESAVIGLPHPDLGEGVTAVVVKCPGAEVTAEAILTEIGPRLARFKQPKRIIFAEALPRNAMGKVQKSLLRKAHNKLYLNAQGLDSA